MNDYNTTRRRYWLQSRPYLADTCAAVLMACALILSLFL
jgi:hypothetical protein